MNRCPSCGYVNASGYRFCAGCGGDLPASATSVDPVSPFDDPELGDDSSFGVREDTILDQRLTRPSGWFCRHCQTSVAHGMSFCPTCGSAMGTGPSVAAVSTWVLTHIRADGSSGEVHRLNAGANCIGRLTGALFTGDRHLSPQHVELTVDREGVVVRDLDSLNGTFLRLTAEEELLDGDLFRLGQHLLRFEVLPEVQPLDDGTQILGSPNPGYWGRLAVVVGRNSDGRALLLLGDSVQLGRERGDFRFPTDGYMSGAHARISVRDGRAWLADLGSSNGTFMRIRTPQRLTQGAILLLGQQLFRLDA
jgi:pSer/pThr/pTyr-binding forkhead associated (FHA) protein